MISLTNEQRLLLDLLAGEISAQQRSYSEQQLRDIDWDALLREAKAQAVPLMAAEALQPYKRHIPDYTPWKMAIAGATTANIQTAYAEQELGVLMGERPFFILKGMAAAAYYPHPQQRMLGDVDFLIDPSQQKEITHLLEQHGYQNWHVDHICHVVFRKGNAHLEMHFEIAGIPYGAPGERVRTFMQNAVQHRHTASFDGWTFPAPDDTTAWSFCCICSIICWAKAWACAIYVTGRAICSKRTRTHFGSRFWRCLQTSGCFAMPK